jgi:hypothetical protein
VIAKDILLLVLALVVILLKSRFIGSMRPWVVRSCSRFCCATGGRIGGEPMTTKERYAFWLSSSDRDAPRRQAAVLPQSTCTLTDHPAYVEAWHQSGRAVAITRLDDRSALRIAREHRNKLIADEAPVNPFEIKGP